MKPFKSIWVSVKKLWEKYPAVLSGYFLIGFTFVAIIRMIIRAKLGSLTLEDLFDVFSALPFMWLLALSIVKLVEERSIIRKMKNALTEEQQQRLLTETKLDALKQAEKALQHNINNPLAVIALSIGRLKRSIRTDRGLLDKTTDIECASETIGTVLSDFCRTQLR
jgi:hypothetical protein